MDLRTVVGITACLIIAAFGLRRNHKNILLVALACILLFVQFGNWDGLDAQAQALFLRGLSSLSASSSSSQGARAPTIRPTTVVTPATHPTTQSTQKATGKQQPQIQASVVSSSQQVALPHIDIGSLLGIVICIIVVFLFLSLIPKGRRSRLRRSSPSSILCPGCGQPAALQKYRVGGRMRLMCSDCAGRQQAVPAGR